MTLADDTRGFLEAGGASLVGFADLAVLPTDVRSDLPGAVAFAVALAPDVVAGIGEGPTRRYYDEYRRANILLGELSVSLAGLLRQRGYRAVSSAATNEGIDTATDSTPLPQKTVATLAGLGWIGKCALLVTEPYGPAVRLNRVLTDAPLPPAVPVMKSRCGDCRACVDACPASAPTGETWEPGRPRDDLFDARACRRGAMELARRRTGIEDTFCGICIAVCPWTRRAGVRAR